jgi:type IV pilus assembly protein PilA
LRIQERAVGQWFYAEGNRQQRGPLASDELIALYQSSRIAADTLVWRDGMAQWQPLREVADEIGLVLATPAPAADTPAETDTPHVALPPQIPADSPPPGPVPAGPFPPVTATAAPSMGAAPPRQGLSGCAIAGIVAGICGLVLVAVIGILAAIALPAYQDYVLRAKTAQAITALDPIKVQVSEFVQTHGRCPVNDDEGFQPAESYASDDLSAVRIGRFDNSHCGIEAELTVPAKAALDGKLLWLDYDPELHQWECTGEPDDKYLPQHCRG